MALNGVVIDSRHQLVAVDYYTVYAIHTTMHAQLYARGMCRRILTFVAKARPVEYRAGIVHVPLGDYEEYCRVTHSLIHDPSAKKARSSLAHQLRQSIGRLARANFAYERRPVESCLSTLLDAAYQAMAFYNLDAEMDLSEVVERHLGAPDLIELFRSALTPSVTPFLVLLSSRAQMASDKQRGAYHRRFAEGAAFLAQFDPVQEPGESGLAGGFDPSSPGSMVGQPTPWARRQRRRNALATLADRLNSRGIPDAESITDLVQLAVVSSDHEEARHYWQARTMRNLRRLAVRLNLDMRETDLDTLVQAFREAACHVS